MTFDQERSSDVDPRLKTGEPESVPIDDREDGPDVRIPNDEGNEHLESG